MTEFQSGRFDKPLSRHIAHLIHSGHRCDETMIRHGYQLTRCELGIDPRQGSDALSRDLESQYVDNDLSTLAGHESTIRRLPFNQASLMVLALLQGLPVPARERPAS